MPHSHQLNMFNSNIGFFSNVKNEEEQITKNEYTGFYRTFK